VVTKHDYFIFDSDGSIDVVPMKLTISIAEEMKKGWLNDTKLPAILYTPNELAIFTTPNSEYMDQLKKQVIGIYSVMVQEVWLYKETGYWMNRFIIGKR